MLAAGYQLKPQAQIIKHVWRMPERRFTVNAAAASEVARLWSQPQQSFEKLTGSLGWHWFPQAQGDDYETSQQLRAGKTFGQFPLTSSSSWASSAITICPCAPISALATDARAARRWAANTCSKTGN